MRTARAQPLIAVSDGEASSRRYCSLLVRLVRAGGHGGPEYERVVPAGPSRGDVESSDPT